MLSLWCNLVGSLSRVSWCLFRSLQCVSQHWHPQSFRIYVLRLVSKNLSIFFISSCPISGTKFLWSAHWLNMPSPETLPSNNGIHKGKKTKQTKEPPHQRSHFCWWFIALRRKAVNKEFAQCKPITGEQTHSLLHKSWAKWGMYKRDRLPKG